MPKNHQHLNEALKKYLISETNYALLISGSWGSGKTYYYKNHLVDLIRETSVFGDQDKEYVPVKVSLFGKKNIQEITDDIYSQVYPLLESDILKKGGKIVMNAAIGYLKNKTNFDLKEYLPEDLINIKKKIKYQQIVLCFDDLERASPDFKKEEIIGYINSLVENDSAKVVIIANEDKLGEEDYTQIKEKTIGVTLEFVQGLNDIYDEIVFDKYAATNNTYYNFLIEEKEFVLVALNNAENNLRHIFYALDILCEVYVIIIKINPSFDRDILTRVILFVLSTALEFRKGTINKNDKSRLSQPTTFKLRDLTWFSSTGEGASSDANKDVKSDEEKKDLLEEIKNKYFKPSYEYLFFSHLFDFVTLAIFINEELLKKDLDEAFPQDEVLTSENKLFFQLRYENLGDISKKEYRTKTSELVKLAIAGKYYSLRIIEVFHFAIRFNNPLRFNFEKLISSLIKGMKKSKNQYVPPIHYQNGLDPSHPDYSYYDKLYSAAMEINNVIGAELQKVKDAEIVNLFYSDIKKFGYEAGQSNAEFYFRPIFNSFSPKAFFKFLKENSYDTLSIIFFTLQSRYRNKRDLDHYKPEKSFFIELEALLKTHVQNYGAKYPVNFMISEILNEVTYAVCVL